METFDDIDDAARHLVAGVLDQYDQRVPETGSFRDLTASCYVQLADPATSPAAFVELAVMHMNDKLDPAFSTLRFLAIRLRKSRDGGMASCTCCHGTAAELKIELEAARKQPGEISDRIEELAEGLDEESNPDLWR